MSSKAVRIARHIYLRTQQRRLRHIRSVLIRNVTVSDLNYSDPLSVSIYFTLHSTHNPSKVLYKSEPLQETFNPSWESVQFSTQQYGKYAAVACFILRLWVRSEEEYYLAHEKEVDLSSFVYLGPFVTKDGSGYPPNSLIVGMFEGYYSHPGVGGILCPPRISHSLNDFLPPQSLLEVQRPEVSESYVYLVLMRVLKQQEVLNKAKTSATEQKDSIQECYIQAERDYFSKRSEREQLKMRLQLLRMQLVEQERQEQEEREKLLQLKGELDDKENDVRMKEEDLQQRKTKFEANLLKHSKMRDQLASVKRNQQLRQRTMIYEISQAYFIKEVEGQYTICNVILPHADQLEQPSSVEQLGVALGYAAHLVYHLGWILLIPLQYSIKPHGSKSSICDQVSDEALIENIKEFPLYAKGSEKALFQYAVYLLNKNIAQIRQHCGYGTSKSMFRKTLPNLKFLLDRLTKDVMSSLMPDASWRMSLPIDTVSLSSFMTADNVSITSSMHAPPLTQPNMEEPGPPVSSQGGSPYQAFPMSLPQNGNGGAMEPAQNNGLSSAAFGHLQLPSGPTNSINADDDDIQATTAAYDFPVEKIRSPDQQHEKESKSGLVTLTERELELESGPLLQETTGSENTPTLFADYPPTNTDNLSVEVHVREDDDTEVEVDVESTETQNYQREGSVTLIPHELVLSVSPSQGSSCSHISGNTLPSPHIAATTTSALRYSGQFGESGVIKTNVATPHIIAHLNDSNNQKNGSRTSSSHLQESSDAHFGGLEDFIDSPFCGSPYSPSQLRPELQVLTERELENV